MLWAPHSSWECAWELCSEQKTKLVWMDRRVLSCLRRLLHDPADSSSECKQSCLQLPDGSEGHTDDLAVSVRSPAVGRQWVCWVFMAIPQGEIKAFVRHLLTWVSKILGISSRCCIPRLQLSRGGDGWSHKPFLKASAQLLPLTSAAFSLEACVCLHVRKCFPVFWNFLLFGSL